ncbi:hypothetical protein EMCRGX_G002474 [Ephydatia muelleri]
MLVNKQESQLIQQSVGSTELPMTQSVRSWGGSALPLLLKCMAIGVEAGNDLTADHSHTRPADLLLTNWATGKTAAFDISVTSPLNTLTLLEAGVSAGSAAQATETRKHMANDAKCNELGWLCVPLVAETNGAWGKEAMEAFSQLASRLAAHTCRLKSAVTFELYSRLNLHLVRANATAILTRYIQS